MYIFLNINNLQIEDILTNIAIILINLDYGLEIFTFTGEIIKNESPRKLTDGELTLIKNLIINIYCPCTIANLRFVLNMRIYNIINQFDMLMNKRYVYKHQHIMEITDTILTFQSPLANYDFKIKCLTHTVNSKQLSHLATQPNSNILFVGLSIKTQYCQELPFKIIRVTRNPIHFDKWLSADAFQIGDVNCTTNITDIINSADIKNIHPLAFDKAKFDIVNGELNMYLASYEEKLVCAPINISFVDIIDNYIKYMEPDNFEICREAIIRLYYLWQNKTAILPVDGGYKINNIVCLTGNCNITIEENLIYIATMAK